MFYVRLYPGSHFLGEKTTLQSEQTLSHTRICQSNWLESLWSPWSARLNQPCQGDFSFAFFAYFGLLNTYFYYSVSKSIITICKTFKIKGTWRWNFSIIINIIDKYVNFILCIRMKNETEGLWIRNNIIALLWI